MIRFRSLVVAIFFLSFTAFAWCQAEPKDEPKPQQEEAKPREEKPQEQAKPPKDEKQKEEKQRPDHVRPEDAKGAHEEHQEKIQSEHDRTSQKSARIPEEKFHRNFGREHHFTVTRVVQTRTIVPGHTRFVYGGYNFIIVEPWPAGFVMTDDSYIEYVDGEYYLVDIVHPEFRVALNVVF